MSASGPAGHLRVCLVASIFAVLAGCSTVQDGGRPPPEAPAGWKAPGEEVGRGMASWYGPGFQGKRTASGERFDMNDFSAAHRSLPFGTRLRVRNIRNGREVIVCINDRGPWSGARIIDLSKAAAARLDLVQAGEGPVVLIAP